MAFQVGVLIGMSRMRLEHFEMNSSERVYGIV